MVEILLYPFGILSIFSFFSAFFCSNIFHFEKLTNISDGKQCVNERTSRTNVRNNFYPSMICSYFFVQTHIESFCHHLIYKTIPFLKLSYSVIIVFIVTSYTRSSYTIELRKYPSQHNNKKTPKSVKRIEMKKKMVKKLMKKNSPFEIDCCFFAFPVNRCRSQNDEHSLRV